MAAMEYEPTAFDPGSATTADDDKSEYVVYKGGLASEPAEAR
jgi:hypothetical protein